MKPLRNLIPRAPSKTMIDSDIPHSLYLDLGNGTDMIIIPADVSDFEVVVDGDYMEEVEESYSLFIDHIQENEVARAHLKSLNSRTLRVQWGFHGGRDVLRHLRGARAF